MKTHIKFFVLLIAFVLFSSQTSNKSSNQSDIKAEIEKVSNSYLEALKSQNVDSVLSFWMDEFYLNIMSEMIITEKEVLRDNMESSFKGYKISERKIISRDIDSSDDLAVEFMEYELHIIINGNLPKVEYGKYLAVWKKSNDGWKIKRWIALP